MVTVAIVGIGRWGKNLIEKFDRIAEVRCCCHTGSPSNEKWVNEHFPHMSLTQDYLSILKDETIDAVVLATPVKTHFNLAEQALRAGKDIFVEKPLTDSTESAQRLVNLANENNCKLFTGYVFLYAPAIQVLRQTTQDDSVVHLRTIWEKFGTFTDPIKYALACHDIGVAHYLFDKQLESVTVFERIGVQTETDLLGVRYKTPDGQLMTSLYDRTSTQKFHSITAVTESGMHYRFTDGTLYKLEDGNHQDITPIDADEPLLVECRSFVNWIEGGSQPPSSGAFGLRVNKVVDRI